MEKLIKISEIDFTILKPNRKILYWCSRIDGGFGIPNILVKKGENKYELIRGKNRLMAYLMTETTEIYADVIENKSKEICNDLFNALGNILNPTKN